jgi:phosphatidate cytidylyltransferase
MGIPASPDAAGGPARSVLRQRVTTALVLMSFALACLFLLPAVGWQLLTCLPIVLAAREWARLAGYERPASRFFVGTVLASCLALVVFLSSNAGSPVPARVSGVVFVAALLFWAIVVPLWLKRGWQVRRAFLQGAAGWIVLVPAWLAAAFLQKMPWLLLAMLLVVWIADTAAYFAGRRFGRHKLAPQISPGKTWEGVVGAIVAVLAYGVALGFALQPSANVYDRLTMLIFLVALTLLGIVGDLFESWIKRGAGAKDSGNLLPGHGGVLDRIDSLTATLPFVALYFLPVLW